MPFPTGNEAFLIKQLGGVPCTATISGSVTSFDGILSMGSTIKSDNMGGDVFVVGTKLTVMASIANQLTKNQVVNVSGTNYQVRETDLSDDPYITDIEVAKVK